MKGVVSYMQLKFLILFLQCEVILHILHAGYVPGGPGGMGTGRDVLNLAVERDDTRIGLNTNIGETLVFGHLLFDAFCNDVILLFYCIAL